MHKKASIKDIAKELNLSITTVSFVINGKSAEMGISKATAQKVIDLIRKWDYMPNNAARVLRTGKSKTIGVIVEDLGNYFFGNVAKVIEQVANLRGYNVFISSTDNNPKTAKELIIKMRNSLVDGLIITPTKGLKAEIDKLKESRTPYVLVDRTLPEVSASHVVLDNYKGAYELTTHLLESGYERIGFITIVSDIPTMIDRQQGFEDALKAAGKGVGSGTVLKVKFDDPPADIIAAIKKFIAGKKDLDALFFATNYLGVHGLEALREEGVSIPEDMAVVSFDDNDLFRLYSPSITVAAQPIERIATEAIDLLLSMIDAATHDKDPISRVLEPALIKRDSSAPRKAHL